jgi:type IV secretory pathway TrbD component
MPRIFVIMTYLLATVLLLVINLSLWVIMVFPLWVLAVSIFILVVSLRGKASGSRRRSRRGRVKTHSQQCSDGVSSE